MRIAAPLGWVALVVAGLAGQPAAAQSELKTAGQLAGYCGGDPATEAGALGRVFCYGYLTGVMQLHRELVADLQIEAAVCPDYAVSREEAAQVFLDYLAANPDEADEPPLVVIGNAAVRKWPCR